MKNNIYNYLICKNKIKIGEQNITIKESTIAEQQIAIELCMLGGVKDIVHFDIINGKLSYYYKNVYRSSSLQYHEELELVEEGRYLIKKTNFESKVIFNEPISIYEKELFVPINRIDSLMYKNLIISLEAMKTYRIRFILMDNGAYKLLVPEKIIVKYNEDNVCVYYKNIENGVEIINEC